MKDYRPLLSNVLILLEELHDDRVFAGGKYSYGQDEAEALIDDLNTMFGEIDAEVEDGERF